MVIKSFAILGTALLALLATNIATADVKTSQASGLTVINKVTYSNVHSINAQISDEECKVIMQPDIGTYVITKNAKGEDVLTATSKVANNPDVQYTNPRFIGTLKLNKDQTLFAVNADQQFKLKGQQINTIYSNYAVKDDHTLVSHGIWQNKYCSGYSTVIPMKQNKN